MKKWIFWAIVIAVIVVFLVFFFKDTLPFVLGVVFAIVALWVYNKYIAE